LSETIKPVSKHESILYSAYLFPRLVRANKLNLKPNLALSFSEHPQFGELHAAIAFLSNRIRQFPNSFNECCFIILLDTNKSTINPNTEIQQATISGCQSSKSLRTSG